MIWSAVKVFGVGLGDALVHHRLLRGELPDQVAECGALLLEVGLFLPQAVGGAGKLHACRVELLDVVVVALRRDLAELLTARLLAHRAHVE
jgi:hypothetical protein